MSVKDDLQAALTAAMKARDEVTTSTIRMLRTAITNAEVAGDAAIELDDEQVLAVAHALADATRGPVLLHVPTAVGGPAWPRPRSSSSPARSTPRTTGTGP